MPRNRLIKREFFRDEKVAALSFPARLLFQSLWIQADDAGNGRGNALLLKADCFPYDNLTVEDVEKLLDEIVQSGMVQLYHIGATRYFRVVNFLRHQKIDRPSKFMYPPPQEAQQPQVPQLDTSPQRTAVEDSSSHQRALADESKGQSQSQRRTKNVERKRIKAQKAAPKGTGSLGCVLDDLTMTNLDEQPCVWKVSDPYAFAGLDKKLLGDFDPHFNVYLGTEFMVMRDAHGKSDPCTCRQIELLRKVMGRCEKNGVEYPKGVLKVKEDLKRTELARSA